MRLYMKKIMFPLLAGLLLTNCNNKKSGEKFELLKSASFLIGNWEHRSLEGTLTETWTKVNDSTYHGEAYFIKEDDTLHHEQISLSQQGTVLTYSPVVKGQNNGKPVRFNLTDSQGKGLIFENPSHNYPQKISYTMLKDSLVAEISGQQQGKQSKERFVMGKVE